MTRERLTNREEAQQRWSLVEEKLGEGWGLPENLFLESEADIFDFDEATYIKFIDGVGSVEDLRLGLNMLSPFADDAWRIANLMSDEDFARFKELLQKERALTQSGEYGESDMDDEWYTLLMPARLLVCSPVADQFEVPLGVALVRSVQLEAEGLLQL